MFILELSRRDLKNRDPNPENKIVLCKTYVDHDRFLKPHLPQIINLGIQLGELALRPGDILTQHHDVAHLLLSLACAVKVSEVRGGSFRR